MILILQRKHFTERSTIGELTVDNAWNAYTLEDAVREVPGQPVASWKIPGKTAIPAGSYDLVIDFSNRFQRRMLHLLDVPGFTGIRIHSGNTDADTEGCILVGQSWSTDKVGASKAAFDRLFYMLDTALTAGESCRITIQGEPPKATVVSANVELQGDS